jgi:16S rRNA processing protein RimM
MEKIKIGKVVNVQGLRGELRIFPYTQSPDRFFDLKTVYLGEETMEITGVRLKGSLVILKVQGVEDRTRAEAFKGRDVFMDEGDLEALPAGTYYVRDLIGLPVEDKTRGPVGVLADVLDSGPQSVFVIRREDGSEFLVPAVEEFFTGVDKDRKVVLVELIEGMYED